ncbi:MAG: pseudouridine-5'-phosphate glycosidase [Armatimonadota bacterium]
MDNILEISKNVQQAINRGEPIVALESSVIAHGLKSPQNYETALAMEEEIVKNGAIPATIGIIEGKIKVGLSKEEIEKLSDGKAVKVAARDIPYVVTKKIDGGTTVSATIKIAAMTGIQIVATGGIGGVHRNIENNDIIDISSDIWELAKTPVVVVCSGIKSILDIKSTVERLETFSVPIYGYKTSELPAFYCKSSGISVAKIDNVSEAVAIIKSSFGQLGVRSSIIIAVPIPSDYELDISEHIDIAESEAMKSGISGKALSPYLLNRIGELTKDKSIESNVELLKNNAKVAASIAKELYTESNSKLGFMA